MRGHGSPLKESSIRAIITLNIPSLIRLQGRFCKRHPALELRNSAIIAGMRGDALGGFTAAGSLGHFFPKPNGLVGIVAGKSHEEDANMICLRLLLSIVRSGKQTDSTA